MEQIIKNKEIVVWNCCVKPKRLFQEFKHTGFITHGICNKEVDSNTFLLKEKGNLVSNEKQLAGIMNSFFINITKGLELKEDNGINANNLEDVLDAFNSHPSIERIRRTIKTNEKLSF